MIYAVIDTNVVVSSLITKNNHAATYLVMRHLFEGHVTPLYNQEILTEYAEVLARKKFNLPSETIDAVISYFETYGIEASRFMSDEIFADEDDRVFYEVSLSIADSFLVTGNLKYYPVSPKVLSPSDFLRMIEGEKASSAYIST